MMHLYLAGLKNAGVYMIETIQVFTTVIEKHLFYRAQIKTRCVQGPTVQSPGSSAPGGPPLLCLMAGSNYQQRQLVSASPPHRRLHRRSPTPRQPPLWPPAEAEVGTSAPTRSGASRRPWTSSTTSPSPSPSPAAPAAPSLPPRRPRLQGFALPFRSPLPCVFLSPSDCGFDVRLI